MPLIVRRGEHQPVISTDAIVAPGARLVGQVHIGPGCVIDTGATLIGSGAPLWLERDVVVMANSLVRSVGGAARPAFPVSIGPDCLIGPASVLVGCTLGAAVYVATQAMVFHGAKVGDGSRLGAASIVHTRAVLPHASHVGMRQFAVANRSGDGTLITSDVDVARDHLAATDFFGTAFDLPTVDQTTLHTRVVRALQLEAAAWTDTGQCPAGTTESGDGADGVDTSLR